MILTKNHDFGLRTSYKKMNKLRSGAINFGWPSNFEGCGVAKKRTNIRSGAIKNIRNSNKIRSGAFLGFRVRTLKNLHVRTPNFEFQTSNCHLYLRPS